MVTKHILFLAGLFAAALSHAQVVDQQQLVTDGALSARAFTDYSVGQSFTAGITGNLVRIDVGFCGPAYTATGTLRICSGPTPPMTDSTTGVLATSTVTFTTAPGGTTMVAFSGFSVAVTAGQKYSFQFIPSNAPDPYAVAVGVSRYAAGVMYQTFGIYWGADQEPFDTVFRTWVQ